MKATNRAPRNTYPYSSFCLVTVAMLAVTVATEHFVLTFLTGAVSLLAVAAFNAARFGDRAYLRATLVAVGVPAVLVVLPLASWVHRNRVEWRQVLSPRELTIDELMRSPPKMPVYVEIRGATPVAKPLSVTYTSRDSKGRSSTTTRCRQPLGSPTWSSRDVVPLVGSSCPYVAGEKLRGWLQVPGSSESMFRSTDMSVGGRVSFDKAGLRVDPARTLFLDVASPLGSLGPPMLMIAFFLVVGALLNAAFSVGFWPSPPTPSKRPSGGSRR